jgi:hypothetical protein
MLEEKEKQINAAKAVLAAKTGNYHNLVLLFGSVQQ